MNKKQLIITAVIVIIIGVLAFYGGMQYANSKTLAQIGQGRNGGGGYAQRQGGQGQGGMRGPQGGNGGAGDFAGGQIIAKDETSITIKTRDGGSKIVFLSSATQIDKSVSGATSDLNVGQQITASGKSNPDGSLAAQNIQIRSSQNQ